jgi:4-hydroxy-3-methylbut-2-enyl diphosphate reductase
VEVAGELDPTWFADVCRVGVTAGASTPDWIIEEVIAKLKGMPTVRSA